MSMRRWTILLLGAAVAAVAVAAPAAATGHGTAARAAAGVAAGALAGVVATGALAAADPGHGAMIARNHAHRITGHKYCERSGRGDCGDVNTISVGNPLKEHTPANSRNFYFHQTGTDDGFPQGYVETFNGFPIAAVNCTVGAGGGSVIITTDTTQTGVVWDFYTDQSTGLTFLTNRNCSGGNGNWSKCLAWFNHLDSDLTIGATAGADGLYKALVFK